MTHLQNLLDKLDVIRIHLERNQPKDTFNIFTILRHESDEANLHSRFLYELLNPKGSHGLGTLFLQLFIETCKLDNLYTTYSNIQILREHNNIDILIRNHKYDIIIENKIYANDQNNQLNRYYEHSIKSYRQPKLLYLTLDGREPSDWSLGSLEVEEVRCISYAQEISSWLTLCINECATIPTIRETLVQYKKLIKSLTGENMNKDEQQEIFNLVSQSDNAARAAILVRNWNYVRRITENEFWNSLLSLVEPNYNVSINEKFSDELIVKLINWSRGKFAYYGILYTIGDLDGINIYSKIERGWSPIVYGIKKPNIDVELYNEIKYIIDEIKAERDEHWMYRLEQSDINFNSFDFSSGALRLINIKERDIIVRNLWKSMQELNLRFISTMQEKFGSRFKSHFRNSDKSS